MNPSSNLTEPENIFLSRCTFPFRGITAFSQTAPRYDEGPWAINTVSANAEETLCYKSTYFGMVTSYRLLAADSLQWRAAKHG